MSDYIILRHEGGDVWQVCERMVSEQYAPLKKCGSIGEARREINRLKGLEPIIPMSTAHIDKETADWLNSDPKDLIVYQHHPDQYYGGWLIYIGDSDEVAQPLRGVLEFGFKKGGFWVLLDNHEDTINGLETYEW